MNESKQTIYRGIARDLYRFDPDVEWWTLSKEDAQNYGTDGEGNVILLTSEVDFDKHKTLTINAKSIDNAYLNDKMYKAVNIIPREISKDKFTFEDLKTKEQTTLNHSLDDIQPYFHEKLRQNGYEIFHYTFPMGSKKIDEIAILKDNIIDYDAPNWYNKKWSTKSLKESEVLKTSKELVYKTDIPMEELEKRFDKVMVNRDELWKQSMSQLEKDMIKERKKRGIPVMESKRKYRVNYMLNESFHYSIVEAVDEDTAEDIVYDALGEPEDFEPLAVEEDKTHLLDPGKDSGMAEIINKLIIDEWEAISGYNSASITAQEMGLLDAARLLSDLSKEELEHVGELQELLKSFDKNTPAIHDGAEEAQEKLEEN